MKIAGIIAEYNPFHKGHSYHIQKTRELTGADFIVAVISGDFIQRGGPAFLPKHLRAAMALGDGADVVLELPSVFSCQSAEFFASRGVQLLDSLGCIDFLSFGSESGNLSLLQSLGDFLSCEPLAFKQKLQENLKKGLSYPAARQQALAVTWGNTQDCQELLSSPNNILGIEYCKALSSLHSTMQPFTISREGNGYHQQDLTTLLPSASGIRNTWMNCSDMSCLEPYFPENVWKILVEKDAWRLTLTEDDFSLLFHYLLYTQTEEQLHAHQDVSLELARKLLKNRDQFSSISQYIQLLRSKDITYTRLSRAIFHILLNIQQAPSIPYARLLGFKKSASCVLTQFKKKGTLPLLTKLSDAHSILSEDAWNLLEKNIQIAHIYEFAACQKQHRPFVNEYTRQLVIL